MSSDRTHDAVRHTAQADAGTAVTAYLLAGPLTFGGIGHLIDRWLGTGLFVAIGVLFGLGLALYVIVLRYGGLNTAPTPPPKQRTGVSDTLPGAVPSSTPAPRTTFEETT